MKVRETTFILSGNPQELLRSVGADFKLRRRPLADRRGAYFDTFDWRLHRAGRTLFLSRTPGRVAWRLQTPDGVIESPPTELKPACFSWDFTPGPLRAELEKWTGVRALLPRVHVEAREREWQALDARSKIVVRLKVSRGRARRPGARTSRPLPARIRLTPLRGYGKQFKTLLRAVARELGRKPSDRPEMELALEAVGLQADDYSSKLSLDLDPQMPAAGAAKKIHRTLLDTMERNERGIRRRLDSEFLHDFRVAVRRTRSALGQIKGVFPAPTRRRFRRQFSWLGDLTGPARDMDVYLLKMGDFKAQLPKRAAADLAPLEHFLSQRRDAEYDVLSAALDSGRYRRFKTDWRRFLEKPPPRRSALPNALRPVAEVASERVWRVYGRVMKKGLKIAPDSPPDKLHRLRIECKKLRYLMEFFRSLYPKKKIGRLIKELKKLQDNLGEFNDYQVQQATLRNLVEDAGGSFPAAAAMAIGRLLERLEIGQRRERENFEARFRRFSAQKNRRTFAALFASADRSGRTE